eukprot:m.152812 g.152812  ORF g.152812 m.152812 type:complete len:299 (+) comp38607_c0_seq9:703-1599(+)
MSKIDGLFSEELVGSFLRGIDEDMARKYTRIFVSGGYTEVEDIRALDEKDLVILCIFNEEDKQKILKAAPNFNDEYSEKCRLRRWVRQGGLMPYFRDFLDAGVTNLELARQLPVTDDTLEKLRVHSPGDRKRLKRMIMELHTGSAEVEELLKTPAHRNIVSVGHWAKPSSTRKGELEMLCIEGFAKVPRGPPVPGALPEEGPIDFMVDSGSEFSVFTPELIKQLKLPYNRTIKIAGAHEVKDTKTFLGVVTIGGVDIDVEIVEGPENCVGVKVLRSFTHLITADSHLWMKHHPPSGNE